MENTDPASVDLLKEILANLRDPGKLNGHPWAVALNSATGRQRLNTPQSGERLVETVTTAFRKMIPPGPPRAGKRMDTRWGTFGILATQYFAPLALGIPFPTSLREAWESMDHSILFFACDRVDGLGEVEIAKYRFAGNELEPAPNSTLSDWHRK
ncbi:MAG: hypothetical protein MUO77_19200, partial [Anaerolineales bacterium]|nr:hypothetical protein [Anaerolineales bacterium]